MDSLITTKFRLRTKTDIKTTLIFPWGTFTYQKIPFGLKNIGATIQRAMPYAFHDIEKIVEVYLDDLRDKYRRRVEPCSHLRVISFDVVNTTLD